MEWNALNSEHVVKKQTYQADLQRSRIFSGFECGEIECDFLSTSAFAPLGPICVSPRAQERILK